MPLLTILLFLAKVGFFTAMGFGLEALPDIRRLTGPQHLSCRTANLEAQDPVVLYPTLEECEAVANAKMQEVKTGFEAENFVIAQMHSFCEAVGNKNNL